MKFPSELKIGAHTFSVVFADSWNGQENDEIGCTNFETGIIYIYTDLPDTLKVSKLIHEIFHVMNPEIDHQLLSSLAEQLTQVLLDNGLIDE